MMWFRLFCVFFKIGLFAFGGGYTIVALAQSELVRKRRWITAGEMADFLAMGQTLPGILSVNFSLFLGNKLGGFSGSLAAVFGMVLPAVSVIMASAGVITAAENSAPLMHALAGIRIAVCVLIVNIAIGQARTAVRSPRAIVVALITCLWVLMGWTPAVPLVGAGLYGWGYYRTKRKVFR